MHFNHMHSIKSVQLLCLDGLGWKRPCCATKMQQRCVEQTDRPLLGPPAAKGVKSTIIGTISGHGPGLSATIIRAQAQLISLPLQPQLDIANNLQLQGGFVENAASDYFQVPKLAKQHQR